MEAILANLNEIKGVIGSALFDETDECIAHHINPPYEPILLTQLMGEVRSALEFLSSLDEAKDWSSFNLWLEEGCVALRSVQPFSLLVLGSSALNMSMLGVGLNVAALKVAKVASGTATGKSNSSLGGSGRMSVSSSSRSVSSSSRNVSNLTPVGDSHARIPGAVGAAMVDALLKTLAKQIGPFAKFAVKEEMGKMGVTPNTLVPAGFEDLVHILSLRINDAEKQKQFVNDARNLLKR